MLALALAALSSALSVARAVPCNASVPYCNISVGREARVYDLLMRASIAEKAGLLFGKGIDRLGVPSLRTGEALHGVVSNCGKDEKGRDFCPSSFPCALNLGATLNRTLWSAVGGRIGLECRALQPDGGARFTPDINLFRDPRWGRGQEVPGEDPHLTSEYVVAFVRALQEGDTVKDPDYLQVIATCKHFFAVRFSLCMLCICSTYYLTLQHVLYFCTGIRSTMSTLELQMAKHMIVIISTP